MKIISTARIWHDLRHNAFTDLCQFKNIYYLAFRTAETHHSLDGHIQILSSVDGENWQDCATISRQDTDLRDPKFTLNPDGTLSIHSMEVREIDSVRQHQSLIFTSADGLHWDQGYYIGEPGIWIWRAKWHQDDCYAIGYNINFTRLYRKSTGRDFSIHKPILFERGFSNESDWVYLQDGTMAVLLRRDGKTDNSAMLGISQGDYSQWVWHDLKIRIGGPCLLYLNDDLILAAIRTYSEKDAHVELHKLDIQQQKLVPLLTLPSAGDCSYAGMIKQGDQVWISYYSSHEDESTDIYLAKLQI